LDELAEERGLDLLAVLFAFRDGDGTFRRQLLLRARGAAMLRALKQYLDTLPLELRELSEPRLKARPAAGPTDRLAPRPADRSVTRPPASRPGAGKREWAGGLYDQGDNSFSRKRLEPALRRFLESRKARAGGR
jgi:hypothetical protein